MNRTTTSRRRKARNIRYHDHEWDRIVANARICGIPAATFVRKVSLGTKPRAQRNRTDNDVILRLGRIATELHRLVRLAERTDELPVLPDIERALDETLSAVRRIS